MILLLIFDDKSYFEFSPKAEFMSTLQIHMTFATDTETRSQDSAQLLQC